ncbi:MAG: hypothetical protein JW862_00495 [Anaerolineales bacterium]|nr:hypothetical protein [Anaerolineales bacterium]
MRSRAKRWLFVLALLMLVTALGQPTWVQSQGNIEYFPETGHSLSGEFLEKYFSTARFDLLYGYPITEAFFDPLTGRYVQYFERARFELFPDQPPELRVRRTLIGEYLSTEGQPANIPQPATACHTFSESGQTVCYAFLDFFNAHGGVLSFGYPVSGLIYQDDLLVQYFQFARFEWHPERPAGKRVQLTDLGERYFEALQEDPVLLSSQPEQLDFIGQSPILDLRVYAFVEKTVCAPIDKQDIYVIVQDQNSSPVQGARITITIVDTNGQPRDLQITQTNELGLSIFNYPVQAQKPGRVEIQVNASFRSIEQQALASFQVW